MSNRHEMIEQVAAARAQHREAVRRLSQQRADAGAELDAARVAHAASERRLRTAAAEVHDLESRVQAGAAVLQNLEARVFRDLQAAAPLREFVAQCDEELEDLRSAPDPMVREVRISDCEREAYSEARSRSRRSAAIRSARSEAGRLTCEIADLAELEHALNALWSALPTIEVERVDLPDQAA